MILWAHNYHIARSEYSHALYADIKAMGCRLSEKYEPDLYAVGLYMVRGKTRTDWDWSIINVEPPRRPLHWKGYYIIAEKNTCLSIF